MSYDIVFVPRSSGASLEEAVAAIDDADVPDTERDRWFARLFPVAQEVLGDVAVDEAARAVEHPATGIRAEVRAGGVVIHVPYEGEVDPMLVMSLTHSLATEVERATGLVGWDTSLGEPVSPRDLPPPRPRPRAADADEEESGAARGSFVVPAAPPEPAPGSPATTQPRRPWWRFWARS